MFLCTLCLLLQLFQIEREGGLAPNLEFTYNCGCQQNWGGGWGGKEILKNSIFDEVFCYGNKLFTSKITQTLKICLGRAYWPSLVLEKFIVVETHGTEYQLI